MTEDDDWFERAITTDDGDEGDDGSEEDTDRDDRADASRTAAGDAVEGAEESVDEELEFDEEDEAGDAEEADASDSLFADDFGAAMESAPDLPGGSPGGDLDSPGTADVSPAEPTSAGEDLEFGSADPAFATTEEPTFDDEIDSDLPRIDLGIEGLDGMIQGGVPERTLMVTIGGAGTGKTTFGIQFLDHALAQGESAVYITLEESRRRVINSATEKGFPFDEYVDEGRLAIVDLDPIEMANSLASIRSELPALVEQFGASRLVLDSVSLLEMMYENQASRRNEIYDFTRSLKNAGVTALLTSEASSETPYASRYGIVEYLTDAVFILQYVRAADDFRETQLAIEIQKIRDANHSRHKKPYEITGEGISVYQQANLF
ncbi:KaiC domain-containing protein [Natrarchaeobaculum aegyptiacum]|uniref:KaiC domain-containing protein n=1 Tax=Natrarchaeobaculum aegyptiacum TaxID=745377 RepID=A0A2Z2HWT4_9EURY|nr:KaiC domain-containing protein [Natrarchaeobaculum aegyptiacum]ARS91720.1 KaiC domain-containing protein [Natrarchaeobaculum aegyptiacum]